MTNIFEMTKELSISGMYKLKDKVGSFNGILTIKENENLCYCVWSIYDENGNTLVGKSMPIYFQQIPDGHDRLAFSQQIAIERIKNYRIGRERLVVELNIDANASS